MPEGETLDFLDSIVHDLSVNNGCIATVYIQNFVQTFAWYNFFWQACSKMNYHSKCICNMIFTNSLCP